MASVKSKLTTDKGDNMNMNLYWPMAITDDGEKLFTTDAAFTVKECFEQFDIWANHYHCIIQEAWIDTYTDKGKARHNCSRVWKIDDVVFTPNPS